MAHNLVIGGQPDYLSAVVGQFGEWYRHGREIAVGDAEKVLDLAPSVRCRAKSIGSGEFYFEVNHSTWRQPIPSRGILGVVHNLADVGGKVRVIVGGGTTLKYATATVTQVNTASGFEEVNNDPYGGTPATFAVPTVDGGFSLEVGTFGGSVALSGKQVILIYLHKVGNSTNDLDGLLARHITLTVKETSTTKATKDLYIKASNGDTFVTSILVDPTSFSTQTLANLRVAVQVGGHTGDSWKIGAIAWVQVPSSGVSFDSDFTDVEVGGEGDLFHMNADAQISTVIPYLDANGEVENLGGASGPATTVVMCYWDESTDGIYTTYGRPRIFNTTTGSQNTIGELTTWRPEIGLIAEGPAYGTQLLQPNYRARVVDPSDVRRSKGGNDWFRRKQPRRTLDLTISDVVAQDAMRELYSVWRRAGITRPFLVAMTPDESFSADVAAALSLYGRITDFSISEMYAELFSAQLALEEVV